jgi:hypothetical protein
LLQKKTPYRNVLNTAPTILKKKIAPKLIKNFQQAIAQIVLFDMLQLLKT